MVSALKKAYMLLLHSVEATAAQRGAKGRRAFAASLLSVKLDANTATERCKKAAQNCRTKKLAVRDARASAEKKSAKR